MKNKKIVFFCQECGYESAKWMGQCPGCKAWNTFVEEPVSTVKKSTGAAARLTGRAEPMLLKDIRLDEDERKTTEIGELDRVLGGGIVPGSLVLVGGDPGIGKSTLLLQVCRNLSQDGNSVLYISGEESLGQIRLRANRIGTFNDKMQLLCETNLDTVRQVMERLKPEVAIIDSIQTMFSEEVGSAPGSVSQVRESTNVLMQIAKGLGSSVSCWNGWRVKAADACAIFPSSWGRVSGSTPKRSARTMRSARSSDTERCPSVLSVWLSASPLSSASIMANPSVHRRWGLRLSDESAPVPTVRAKRATSISPVLLHPPKDFPAASCGWIVNVSVQSPA